MIVDHHPILEELNKKIYVSAAIDISEDINIVINGLVTYLSEDLTNIVNNEFVIINDSLIDWYSDDIQVIFTELT